MYILKSRQIILVMIALIAVLFHGCKKDDTETTTKKDPIITWANPADISFGTLLSDIQLNATADVSGTFVYTPAIGTKLNAGTNQDLKVDFTPTDAATYNVASKIVKINVNTKKDPIITWANPADISFGTLLSDIQLNATADVPGTFVYTPAIGTKLNVGTNQDLKVDFTPTDAATYNVVSNTVKINVNAKKDPIITWANPADISFGTLLSTTQLNATADVPGTFVYTPAIGTKLNAGTNQDLKVDFTPTDAVTYNVASKTVKINVSAKIEHSITTYTDVEFSLTAGSSTYGRLFSFDDGKIYKDSEINATIGSKIHLAFGSMGNTMYFFESPTVAGYKVPGATVTKVTNYLKDNPISTTDFDSMTDDTKFEGLTINETNDSFGNSSIPGIVLFQLASGRKGVIKTKAVNSDRLLVDIKIQN